MLRRLNPVQTCDDTIVVDVSRVSGRTLGSENSGGLAPTCTRTSPVIVKVSEGDFGVVGLDGCRLFKS